jgi:hypothetical protein
VPVPVPVSRAIWARGVLTGGTSLRWPRRDTGRVAVPQQPIAFDLRARYRVSIMVAGFEDPTVNNPFTPKRVQILLDQTGDNLLPGVDFLFTTSYQQLYTEFDGGNYVSNGAIQVVPLQTMYLDDVCITAISVRGWWVVVGGAVVGQRRQSQPLSDMNDALVPFPRQCYSGFLLRNNACVVRACVP